MIDIGTRILALNIGVERWNTPAFAPARMQLQAAHKKKGAYDSTAGVKITIPAIGHAESQIFTVANDGERTLTFKSEKDSKLVRGEDKFMRKWNFEVRRARFCLPFLWFQPAARIPFLSSGVQRTGDGGDGRSPSRPAGAGVVLRQGPGPARAL